MTKQIYQIVTKAGIQRDGTLFDSIYYRDGQWVRFQRGRPRKIGGYREITNGMAGPSRGIYVSPQSGYTVVFNGYSDGLQSIPVNNDGIGAGIVDWALSNFTASPNNLWQFDNFFDASGSGNNLLLAHPGQNLSDINNSVNTPVLAGNITGSSASKVGVFTQNISITSTSTTATIVAPLTNQFIIGAGQTVSGTGIQAGTTVSSVVGTTITLSLAATATNSSLSATFDNNIAVSGGLVVLFPYVFVYGNNGLIQNSGANNVNDWVSATANATNVATGKIVQGLPVRGGVNAPSGLFWSLDSVIRVSYTPTTVTTGSGSTQVSQTFYWRYDTITSQSSILSSQSVIEYDGIFYWCGVDRFMLYNGVVKEIPNDMNQNYFFDNLNYSQRQKVYATKVPRYGEIWWFYPANGSNECNNAIIYNVREGTWYDAGFADGANRSAGYFSQVFHYPVNADWRLNGTGGVNVVTIGNAGSGYTNGTYSYIALTGGSGTGATATVVVSGGAVTSVTIQNRGTGYVVGNTLSATIPAGSGFALVVQSTMSFVSLYQHEIGTDAIKNEQVLAINSFFETNSLAYVLGNSAQMSPMSTVNKWWRVERVEPDFILSGTMDMYILGRPYAQIPDQTTGPYTFDANTGKIDLKEQRREMRLRFVSNVAGGNYQLGRIMLDADVGDVRGYS